MFRKRVTGHHRGWRAVTVRGPSMSTTLSDDDVVLARFGRSARPGDVVLVRWPARPEQLSVKRAVRPDGALWWVEGDNPFGSTDSRTLGPAEVVAVVTRRLWPRPRRL
ncbi:S26 family signal peptidase [Pseudonocardia sp. NPDC049154]|uniref:S26 family signal peptidase n=1 Tax=Pseudonocardia sp. NPDC049154 TaxID=3155501 RepID=UPI0033FA702C